MKHIRIKTVLLSVFILIAATLLLSICLLWPVIRSAVSVKQLEDGLYSIEYSGGYGLNDFLEQGGRASDMAVADFVIDRLFHGLVDLNLQHRPFGCSTLSVSGPEGGRLFGRNFDWGECTTLIVRTQPKDGCASVSTVNVEYVNNEMSVVETPIATNFYLTPGEKYGIGTEESHRRYEILTETLRSPMSMDEVRDAMDSVSKHNFDSVFASTEWSVVFDQSSGEARYYHRENYEKAYSFWAGR